MKKIYIIRHCEAEGQPFGSQLTERGFEQAEYLTEFFSDIKIDQIISSPFLRAIQSLEPLSKKLNLSIEIEERLSERLLSTTDLEDWLEKLKATFIDMDLSFEGGESNQIATNRGVSVIKNILESDNENTIIVTHGNLMTLQLKYFDNDFGFEQWRNLSNPDIFLLIDRNNEITIEHLWKE